MALACLADAGRSEDIGAKLAELPSHDQRVRVLHRFLVDRFGMRQATMLLAQQGVEPAPDDLLAVMLVHAMPAGSVDREAVAAIRGLAERSAACPGLRPAHVERLAEVATLAGQVAGLTGA